MRAAELVRIGLIELRERPMPEPQPGEVLLRVDAALTCGTDLKTFRRGHPKFPLPTPLGHEFSGTVVDSRAPGGPREGDGVLCAPTAPCGSCRPCRRGRESLCPAALEGMMLGAFAEYICVPASIAHTNLFVRPTQLSAREAAALEPLACVVHGASRIRHQEAEHIVIIGDGAIALLFVALLRALSPARVLALGHHEPRLAVAAGYGAATLLHTDESAARDHVRHWTGGLGADVVIECVGQADSWEQAARLAGVGGEVLLFGGCAAGSSARFESYPIHYEEVDIKGAFHYGRADVRGALQLLASGVVDVKPLITHERPLAALHDAFELISSRTAIKVAVLP